MIFLGKSSKPYVAIIVPLYNAELFLDKCINSIVAQSYDNLRIILVDDGSSDSTLGKCLSWAKKDERVFVYHKNNGGSSSARNFGLEHIGNADYVMFVDSDDWLNSEAVKILVDAASNTDSDIVCFDFVPSDGSDLLPRSVAVPFDFPSLNISSGYDCLKEIYSQHLGNYVWCFFYSAYLFKEKKIKFEDDVVLIEDALFINIILRNVERVTYVHKPLYYYLKGRTDSLTVTHNIVYARQGLNALSTILTFKVPSEYYSYFYNYIFDLLVYMYKISGRTKVTSDPSLHHDIREKCIDIPIRYLNNKNRIKYILLFLHCFNLLFL